MTNHPSDPIDLEELRRLLAGSLFGVNLLYYDLVESTNNLVKSLALQGGPEGTVVIADEQSAGRGRMGRTWLSRPGENLLFSFLLRPAVKPEEVFVLTMVLAVTIAQSLQRRTGVAAKIKWPNDLYAGRRKLAGILTEIGLKAGRVDHVVFGMGLNVGWRPEEGGETRSPATSLLTETGKRFRRGDLLVWILREFEDGYRRLLNGEVEGFYTRWNDLSLVLGRSVIVESGEERICGTALSIDRSGALILREADGVQRRIVCGDVSLRLREA